MDIIKSILHVFKKSDNAFKIMHPETESAQITDWNQGIVNTLASTALGGLVNTLTSDSLLAKMIQKVLEATGVKYSLGQNGYVCFGSLVGGLIIQWIYSYASGKTTVQLPITMGAHMIALISGIGYATNTFQREVILDNATVTVSRNGSAEDGAYILIVGKM
ncbi:MAG: hypothetical protein MR524_08390 [Megasphaera elsdenii]|nr:hypothetical protein [Megasphaera elsdenii]